MQTSLNLSCPPEFRKRMIKHRPVWRYIEELEKRSRGEPVIREVEIVKEVPVEVIKEVIKRVEVVKQVPIDKPMLLTRIENELNEQIPQLNSAKWDYLINELMPVIKGALDKYSLTTVRG